MERRDSLDQAESTGSGCTRPASSQIVTVSMVEGIRNQKRAQTSNASCATGCGVYIQRCIEIGGNRCGAGKGEERWRRNACCRRNGTDSHIAIAVVDSCHSAAPVVSWGASSGSGCPERLAASAVTGYRGKHAKACICGSSSLTPLPITQKSARPEEHHRDAASVWLPGLF
jgi:hypothetical protein